MSVLRASWASYDGSGPRSAIEVRSSRAGEGVCAGPLPVPDSLLRYCPVHRKLCVRT
jgi:hypothetical protein